MQPTVVTYPQGATRARARVLAAGPWGVITDTTCFHPLDHTWPDQPADRGTLAGQPVTDCLVGAYGPDGGLRIGADIPVRRGEPGWTWVVIHVAEAPEGEVVDLEVDAEYRAALSRAHTACHLSALALNRATADRWHKEPPRRDSLGSPDLDGIAIVESRIEPDRSTDTYRLGKSLRKKGFAAQDLLDGLAQRVDEQLAAWVATGAEVRIETGGDTGVAARRTWLCELPGGTAAYPCGGTHVASLAELGRVAVEYRPTDDGFQSVTTVR